MFASLGNSRIVSQAQIIAFNYWICIWYMFSSFCFSDTKLEATSTTSSPISESITSKEQCSKALFPSKGKQNFTRHSSLIKLVKSIENDRRKIQSAPTTPVKISASMYLFIIFLLDTSFPLFLSQMKSCIKYLSSPSSHRTCRCVGGFQKIYLKSCQKYRIGYKPSVCLESLNIWSSLDLLCCRNSALVHII